MVRETHACRACGKPLVFLQTARAKAQRAYRKANADAINAKRRAKYAADKAARVEAQRAYRAEHADALTASSRKNDVRYQRQAEALSAAARIANVRAKNAARVRAAMVFDESNKRGI